MRRSQDLLPRIGAHVPGPKSRLLAARLQRVECPDTTYLAEDFPIFWERAEGANVWDVDGNRYVDLSAAFGVCSLGHSNPRVAQAVQDQVQLLAHAMGDVHPTQLKVELAETLAGIAPGDLGMVLFGLSGSDAIEAALKTAVMITGRPGCLAFSGAYHGLSYGALPATWREDFKSPFGEQLNPHLKHLPYPDPFQRPLGGVDGEDEALRAIEQVDRFLRAAAADPIGAVLVEPMQGRGGVIIPHPVFLRGLREVCDRRQRVLIVDEIFTGLGRTGRWFACEHSDVVPDLLCVGKSLAGGLPLSACIGKPALMQSWGRSQGEARQTSTFLGHPLACAAALATVDELKRRDWPQRVADLGQELGSELAGLLESDGVADVRGLGLFWGIELESARGAADAPRCFRIVCEALRHGYILLGSGSRKNVLQLTPPFVLGSQQRRGAVELLGRLLQAIAPSPPLSSSTSPSHTT